LGRRVVRRASSWHPPPRDAQQERDIIEANRLGHCHKAHRRASWPDATRASARRWIEEGSKTNWHKWETP
jgi:hypothetical protein